MWYRSKDAYNQKNNENNKYVCPTRFDHCCDPFRGFVSKYQVILTKYSPGARESTDLLEFLDKTESKYSMFRILHVHITYVTIEIICYYGDKSPSCQSCIVIGWWSM